jgi:hypothetical protein
MPKVKDLRATEVGQSRRFLMSRKYFRFKKGFWAGSIILFALIFLCSSAHAGWEVVDPPDVSSNWELFGVRFAGSNSAWAVGKDFFNHRGVILRLSGGASTSITPPNVSADWGLSGVDFPSSSQGWAVGQDVTNKRGVLLRFLGDSWTSVFPPGVSADWKLSSVYFPSLNEGWAVGLNFTDKEGVILRFSQGSWTSFTRPDVSSDWELTRVHFPSINSGWAVGRDFFNKRGVILRFSAGGWTFIDPLPSVSSDWDLRGVHFPSLNQGWAVGRDSINKKGLILRFSGGSWTSVLPPGVSSDWELNSVLFLSSDEGWAVGEDLVNNKGVVLHFSGGEWTPIVPPELPVVGQDWKLSDLDFNSPDNGWAVGTEFEGANVKGVLFRKTEPDISVVPANINFRDVAIGAFLEKTVTVKNMGTGNLDLDVIAPPPLPFVKKADPCSGVSLAPNQACKLTFRFEPTVQETFSTSFDILSNDPDQSTFRVDLTGNGVTGSPVSIQLTGPPDGDTFTACSDPPTFQWNPSPSDAFRSIELQFALETEFLSVLIRSKGKKGANELVLKPKLWDQVLLLPGAAGGTVYWMTVGTKADKTMVESDIFSLTVEAPSAVGNPQISGTSKAALPMLSWENSCNTGFTIWFGNNADFTDPATKKKSLSYSVKNPDENGGIFTTALSSKKWISIRKLVGDVTGSIIYWYVESEDVLGRPNQTGVMNFVLTD